MAEIVCTKEKPWDGHAKGPVVHVDAQEGRQRDGYPGGDLVDMYCPNCGHRWIKELPQ